MASDPYIFAIIPLLAMKSTQARTGVERAAYLVDQLERWNSRDWGDWRDAVAVQARRERITSANSHTLLARIVFGVDAKRGDEIGKLVLKFATRPASRVSSAVSEAGGLKTATSLAYVPPKRPRVRRL